jgi:ankyrin repeat protein
LRCAAVVVLSLALAILMVPLCRSGKTIAIHGAAANGDSVKVECLLVAGIDANTKSPSPFRWDWTPLHQAARGGHPDVAELLLMHGAAVDAKGWCGWTPLHEAAYRGHHAVVEVLLRRGADVNRVETDNFWTPLDAALREGRTATAQLLRANGGRTSEEIRHTGTAVPTSHGSPPHSMETERPHLSKII